MRRATAARPLTDRYRFRAVAIMSALFVVAVVGPTAGRGADLELGRYLATECITCHGTAKTGSTIPNIFALGEAHFVEVIKAYRVKALPNPVMQSAASRLNDEEIAALAAFFQTAKKGQ